MITLPLAHLGLRDPSCKGRLRSGACCGGPYGTRAPLAARFASPGCAHAPTGFALLHCIRARLPCQRPLAGNHDLHLNTTANNTYSIRKGRRSPSRMPAPTVYMRFSKAEARIRGRGAGQACSGRRHGRLAVCIYAVFCSARFLAAMARVALSTTCARAPLRGVEGRPSDQGSSPLSRRRVCLSRRRPPILERAARKACRIAPKLAAPIGCMHAAGAAGALLLDRACV